MAFNPRDYPAEWPEIRKRILKRAGNRCEGTPQHPYCRAKNGKPHPETGRRVILTTAHMWDDDKMNCDPANLRSLCQRCHLNWDRPHHLAKQKRNREAKWLAVQPRLPLEEKNSVHECSRESGGEGVSGGAGAVGSRGDNQ